MITLLDTRRVTGHDDKPVEIVDVNIGGILPVSMLKSEYDELTAPVLPATMNNSRVYSDVDAPYCSSITPSAAELAQRYDFTPYPSDMPDIDFDNIEPIPF